MKKFLSLVFVAFSFIFASNCVNAAVNVFSDDFNGYTAGKGLGSQSNQVWTSKGGSVAEGDSTRGSIAKVTDDSTSDKMYIVTPLIEKQVNETVVYIWDYMTDNPTSDQRIILYGVTESNEEKKVIQFKTAEVDGVWKLQYQNSSNWCDICELESGVWYHFKTEVNYATGKSALYVDYEKVFDNGSVMQSASITAPYQKISFGTNNANADTGVMYIDSVSVNSLGDYAEVFADDFDAYTANNGLGGQSNQIWTSQGGMVSVGKDENCAKVTDESTTSTAYIATPIKTIDQSVVRYEWDYMSDTLTKDQRTILYGITQSNEEKKVIQFKTAEVDGVWKLQYQNGAAWADICEFEAEKWYHFDMTVDFENGVTKLYVNDEEIFTDGGFMASAAVGATAHKITFGTNNQNSDTGVMYIDNVKIYTGEKYSDTPDLSNITYYCQADEESDLKKITALEKGEITVKTKIVNLSENATNAVVVAAMYRDGKLVDVDMHTSEKHSNKNTCFDIDAVVNLYCSVNADIEEDDTAKWTLQTFLWKGMDEIVPVCESKIIE